MDQPRLMEAVFTVALLMGVSMPQPVIRNPDNRRATMITKFIGIAATMMLVVMPAIAGSLRIIIEPSATICQTARMSKHSIVGDILSDTMFMATPCIAVCAPIVNHKTDRQKSTAA